MPRALAARLARSKAETARDQIANDRDIADAYVLAADTVVSVGRRIFVKPEHIEEAVAIARAALRALASRADGRLPDHARRPHPHRRSSTRACASSIWPQARDRGLHRLSRVARQGRRLCHPGARRLLRAKLIGSYTNVVGLPLTEVVSLLIGEGFPVHFRLAPGRRGRSRVEPAQTTMVSKSATQAEATAGRCPICRSPTEAAYRPFCSARCRDVDLSRWLGGGYAIAGDTRRPTRTARIGRRASSDPEGRRGRRQIARERQAVAARADVAHRPWTGREAVSIRAELWRRRAKSPGSSVGRARD